MSTHLTHQQAAKFRKVVEYLIEVLLWLALALITFAMIGCGERSQSGPLPNKSPQTHPASVFVADSASSGSLASVPTTGDTSPKKLGGGTHDDFLDPVPDGDVTETLNSILTDYVDAHDRVPRDLEEMVGLKLIPRIPESPRGKRYVIRADRRDIVLTDQN